MRRESRRRRATRSPSRSLSQISAEVAFAINEAVFGCANHQIATIVDGFVETQYALRRDFDTGEQFAKRFAATFAFNGENHRTGEAFKEFT